MSAPLYKGSQPFHVLQYRLDLYATLATEDFGGTSEITMLLTAAADSLVLNAARLQLDSVQVDGVTMPTRSDSLAEEFVVLLDRIRNSGDTLHVTVAYRRLPGIPRPSSRQGYYFFQDTIGLPSNLGYTMSEPSDARFWVPCYDQPWEKAPADISITVPAGYVAASNGRLVGVKRNPEGTVTWQWNESHPIATYLMCVTASKFSVSTLPFTRGAGDVIPAQYYVWGADSAQCASFLPTVVQMIAALSGLYGPYPFDKYGMSGVVPFAFGGMEHQTITTLNRYVEVDDRVVSHELAHQWWGDLVTCGTWADIWLNESFASYSEALWRESTGGHAALTAYMDGSFRHFNYASWLGAVYDPAGQGFNLFDDVVYSKGAWVLHMLRGIVGDSTFFRILSAYRQKFSGKSAVTAEFVAVADSVTGTDLDWFFSEWVYGPGWPQYLAAYDWKDGVLYLTITQIQSPPAPLFTMPMSVRAYNGTGITDFAVRDSQQNQSFSFALPQKPDSVVVDPDGWLLGPIYQSPSTGSAPVEYRVQQNYPNPFNGHTRIIYSIPEAQIVTVKVFDTLGREVATLVRGYQTRAEYRIDFDGAGLASGVYFYRVQAGSFSSTRKMLLIR